MPERLLPPGLRDALKNRRIVPFAGAGLSKGVRHRDSGAPIFPNWMELLERAANLLHEQGDVRVEAVVRALLGIEPPDFLDAAKRAQEAVKPAVWSDFLYKQFVVDRTIVAEDSLAQAKQLWRLGSKVIITTNYDNVLEWASPGSQALPWHIENEFGLAQFVSGTYERPTVWHLHGDISHPNELILSPDGYTRLYRSETRDQTEKKYDAALTALKTILVTRRLLFVGFSFADVEFGKQLDWLRKTFRGQSGPHYALVHRNRFKETVSALKEVDVECVCYTDHGAPLLALFDELAAIVSDEPISALPPSTERAPHPVPQLSSLAQQARGQKLVNAKDWFPDCATMSIDSGGQGDSAESFNVLIDIRFGRGQLKTSGLTLQYAVAEAELLYDLKYCEWEGPLLGDETRHPYLVPEPRKWRIIGPLDNQGTLAGSTILNEALGRVRASPEQPMPNVAVTLECHRSHLRYTVLDGTTDDPIEISTNKAAAVAAFLNKCQLDEGGWIELSQAGLVWS